MEVEIGELTVDIPEQLGLPLMVVPYGSSMYGTSTQLSDFDFKVLILPPISSLYFKERFEGKSICFRDGELLENAHEKKKIPGDIEVEFIQVQKFLLDILLGQTYALEITCFLKSEDAFSKLPQLEHTAKTRQIILDIFSKYGLKSSVLAMASFAYKQTFDYVNRGKLFKTYDTLSSILESWQLFKKGRRIGGFIDENESKLKQIEFCEVSELGLRVCNSMFDRDKNIIDLIGHVQSKSRSYGSRVKATLEKGIDWKSISHAIRIYWQCIDLMEKGEFSFPVSQAQREFLLSIKYGERDVEETKTLLEALEEEVQILLEKTQAAERKSELSLQNNLENAKLDIIVFLNQLYRIPS